MNVIRHNYRKLFEPGNIGHLGLRNRIVMGVFPTGYAQDSMVTERMLCFYKARARGGAAMIVVEGPCLDYPRAYTGGTQLRLDEVAYLPGLRSLVETIHAEGAKAMLQLSYPAALGTGANRVSVVDTTTIGELNRLSALFAKAASRAKEVGFDGVEIQAGWGQLVSRLLSPASNQRQDAYGGPLANRARFLLETMSAVRDSVGPAFSLQVKLAAKDYESGGFDLPESQTLAAQLEQSGVSSILVTAGVGGSTRRWGLPPQAAPNGVLVPLAAAIKRAVKIPVVAIGKITQPELAESILEDGQADFIGLTRALIADPDWPQKASEGRAVDIRGCISCLHDCVGGVPGLGRACTVNPYAGREGQMVVSRAERSKKVVIIGGGPAGIQAAITTAERGHFVHLFERKSRLGGPFGYPAIQSYKHDVATLPRYLEHRLEQLGVKVSLGVPMDSDAILRERPDAVVIATGITSLTPPIPGIDRVRLVQARKIWAEDLKVKGQVAIIGGGSVGCETAELLVNRGCKVTVLEILPDVLGDMKAVPKEELLGRLKEKGVTILTGAKVSKLEPDRLFYADSEGAEHALAIDSLVLAAGGRSDRRLTEELSGKVAEIYVAGDSKQPGNGGMAVRAGLT